MPIHPLPIRLTLGGFWEDYGYNWFSGS